MVYLDMDGRLHELMMLSFQLIDQLKAAGRFSITLDAWSDNSKRGWLAVTVHYWSGTKLASATGGVRDLPGEHTAEVLADKTFEILDDLQQTTENVVVAVTDNATVMNATCRILGVDRSPCLAHLLQLVVSTPLTKKYKKPAESVEPNDGTVDELVEELTEDVPVNGQYDDEEVEAPAVPDDAFCAEAFDILQICGAIVNKIRSSITLTEQFKQAFIKAGVVRFQSSGYSSALLIVTSPSHVASETPCSSSHHQMGLLG